MELIPLIIGILLVPICHHFFMKLILILGTFDGKIDNDLLEKYKVKRK